jgi:hypothetical protein
MTRRTRHTAIHEAGHAVIGRVLKQVCGGASIVPNEAEGEAGHAICADSWVTCDRWHALGRFRGDMQRSIVRRVLIGMIASLLVLFPAMAADQVPDSTIELSGGPWHWVLAIRGAAAILFFRASHTRSRSRGYRPRTSARRTTRRRAVCTTLNGQRISRAILRLREPGQLWPVA